jgi:phospholipid/cholesterol/gamma-HCH transport system substrate-binding protein
MRPRFLAAVVALLAGALTLGGCGFSVYDLPLPGGTSVGSDPLTVKVQLADALDLVPDSTVKVNDVSVGNVKSVDLQNGIAVVTIDLRRDTELPANATAEIKQTSLLGEKFIDLETPSDPSSALLASGDTIPLSRTGDNPEIEQVLGALSLVLNGGGVAQLKTISTELNKALGGHEDAARSVIAQVEELSRGLDAHKQDIVHALSSLDRVSRSVHDQEATIDQTLNELPSALSSLDSQRKDLVTMLKALDHLGRTGVRVIGASKANTIGIIRDLQPTLTELADSGDNFVNSFNTLLTYPFVDQAVGGSPQVARNLHMGDYVNLDVTLDLNMSALQNNTPGIPTTPCTSLDQVNLKLKQLLGQAPLPKGLCANAIDQVNACKQALAQQLPNGLTKVPAACKRLGGQVTKLVQKIVQAPVKTVCGIVPIPGLCPGTSSSSRSPSPSPGGGVICGLLNCRATPAYDERRTRVTMRQLGASYDPSLVALMVPGLAVKGATS